MTADVIDLYPSTHAILPAGYVNGAQLAAAADVTFRRIDFWTRSGYLHPATKAPGSGHQRLYPAGEVAVVRLMRLLTADGLLPNVAVTRARELLDTGTTHLAGMPIHLPEEL